MTTSPPSPGARRTDFPHPSSEMSENQKRKAECNSCHGETWHEVLFRKADKGTEDIDEEFSIDWGTTWTLVQCRGCDSVSLITDSWNSEACDHEGRPEISTTYFPPRVFREMPTWIRNDFLHQKIPPTIRTLASELYVALQNEGLASATMIMRAIFEHVMISKIGDRRSFVANLSAFQEEGHVSAKQREVVESMLEVGHAAIHRGFVPKKEDVVSLTDILENVLQMIYVHHPAAREIKKRVPKRKKAKRAKSTTGPKPSLAHLQISAPGN